jgi:hypothetical protein
MHETSHTTIYHERTLRQTRINHAVRILPKLYDPHFSYVNHENILFTHIVHVCANILYDIHTHNVNATKQQRIVPAMTINKVK